MTTSIPVYGPKHTFDLKNSNFGYAGFQEKIDTPPLKSMQPKLRPVLESSTLTHPLQNYVCFLPLTTRPGSYAHKPTPCIAPRMDPSYTHSRMSHYHKIGLAYKSENSGSTVPLSDNCLIFQDGCLPFQYTQKHSSPLRQALHAQIAARKFFSVFYLLSACRRISSNSAQPHESAARPLQRAPGHIKGTHPLAGFGRLPPWESVNQANGFSMAPLRSPYINYS